MKYQCVGGPLDGRELECNSARLLIPRMSGRCRENSDSGWQAGLRRKGGDGMITPKRGCNELS